MTASWRPLLTAAFALALLAPAAAAQALDRALDRAAVEELEGLLRGLGFDPGPVDGVVDDDTTEAIRRYQDFALLPGEPEPDQRLLDELRGVAAAFAALSAAKATPPAAPDGPAPPQPTSEVPQKVIVPPPPPPPKLTAAPEPSPSAEENATEENASRLAALPPPATGESPPAPVDDLQARIDAELLRFLHRLHGGSLTREDLAREFNTEGRRLLQEARYAEAIFKFSVAIHLDPLFAGAYSNRGTAYRHRDEPALAQADFNKAKELGFGGLRLRDATNPLN